MHGKYNARLDVNARAPQTKEESVISTNFFGVLVLLMLVAFFPLRSLATLAPAAVDTVSAAPAELVEKVQQARSRIEASEVEKRKILGVIYTIQQRMKKITQEKNTLTDELFHVQDNVRNIAKIIASLESQIVEQRHLLKHRLAALYKLSGEGYVAVLFSQENPLDVDETLRNLKIVTEKDYLLIRSYQENVAQYKSHRLKLKTQVEHLVTIERKIKKQEGLLAKEHKQKFDIVSNLDHDLSVHIKKIKNLRTTSGSQWSDLLRPSIFEQKGQLISPINGEVARDFGLITDEHYKIQLSHKGWQYSAPKGTPVAVVFDGSVAFVDWIKGYGLTVIVDHGDHYYSVYAHISRAKVRTGDILKKGQIIAEAGSESRLYSEGLYFEIRHFSEPENPAHWIGVHGYKIGKKDFEPTAVSNLVQTASSLILAPLVKEHQ
jgi:septal ring factor EnvC (AmiA/AmiB activator)